MSELQDLIKRIRVGATSTESYIYYDTNNGKIHKISAKNVPDENYSIFPIPNEEVKPILTGQKRTDEFVIFYDVSSKQIRLKEIAYEDNHKTASTMCHQLPVIRNLHDGHVSLTKVYEGMDVYVWDKTHSYTIGQCVWHNGSVYKLASNTEPNNEFDIDIHSVIVDNVFISTLPTQNHVVEKTIMTPEYVGIHVDVWYDELSHLAGQHVWVDNTVYKILEDQDANTEFNKDNAEHIVSNVKLYFDKNKSLEVDQNISIGDVILNDNKIYRIARSIEEFNKDKTSIFFYNTPDTLLYYNNENCLEVTLSEIEETIDYKNIKLDLTLDTELKNGTIILSGKNLFQVEVDKEYDIIVQQNTINKSWSMVLNPYTKKFLLTSGYSPKEFLYFSITSKFDPNILYRTLEFSVGELLSNVSKEIPFIYDVESDDSEVSIYTAKYFESYAHEVI